jgi:cell division septation protein DedD
MDGIEDVRGRDKVELSLDGRQIASIVVGALVLLGVVFVLGLNIGRQLAARQLESTRGDALAALDQPPPTAAIPSDALTFHDRLTKDRAPPAEPPPAPPPPAPVAQAAPPPAPSAAAPAPAAEPRAAASAEARPAARPAFSVQVVATPSRAEADRLVTRLKDYTPRVEEAEVPGKGKLYRVRVGAFASKPEAEKFLKGFTGKTGSKGLVVASK